jgi:2-C-methyl-D-erythritol 4-phosphate cytidylyltransferase
MDCIYLAAGLGTRMQKPMPKQFLRLVGKPIIAYSLEILEKIPQIQRILVVYNPNYRPMYKELFQNYNLAKCLLVEGGKIRQESVWNGLQQVKSDKVMVHEASRPFITEDFIQSLFAYPEEKAVVPVIPIPFTVSRGDSYMTAELDRAQLHNIQLPQIFSTDVLRRAHLQAQEEKFVATEDGILVFRLGEKVRFIPGMENNIKVTTPLDLIIADVLLRGIEKP